MAYQEINGARHRIASRYVLRKIGIPKSNPESVRGKTQKCLVGFELGAYDQGKPLVIDPVLTYSTFLGGVNNDFGWAIAVDSSGNAFILGHCNSADFPLKDPIQTYPNDGNFNLFVTQLDASGAALVYSTYLGGNQFEDGLGIAVDSTGAVYIAGYTEVTVNPPHFPTTPGAFRTQNAGNADALVARISAAGPLPVTPPTLSLARSGNTVRISWPANATGFGLQMAETLSLPINWSAASPPPTAVGGENVVTNTISGFRKFYRLRRP